MVEEHFHEDFWVPCVPGEFNQEKKTIKRKLRKAEYHEQLYPVGMFRNRDNNASVDVLDREITSHEIRILMKVVKDCQRKNYYFHMHDRPKVSTA